MKKQEQDGPDIVELLTRIQQQIAAIDRKVDSLISRSLQRPVEARPASPSSQGPVLASERPDDRRLPRPMFPAICADCTKSCELPFKPSGDRPVYCKECFSRRKAAGAVKVAADNKPKITPPVAAVVSAAVNMPEPPAKAKKKPAAAKKPVAKKKPVQKKKK